MKMETYERVLKLLDRWSAESHAVAAQSLEDKLRFQAFCGVLGGVRSQLRLHYYDAEDVSTWTFRMGTERTLKAVADEPTRPC